MTRLKKILSNWRTGRGIYSFGSEKCPSGYGNVVMLLYDYNVVYSRKN